MDREPLITAGVVTAVVTSLLALVTSFGLDITDDQQAAILGFVAVAAPIVLALAVRPRVTPTSAPRDDAGRVLVPAPDSSRRILPGEGPGA